MEQTFIYFAIIAVGACVGVAIRARAKLVKINQALILAVLACLVLLLGMSVGSSEDVVHNIGKVGLDALILAAAAMVGSAVLVHGVYIVWLRKLEHEK